MKQFLSNMDLSHPISVMLIIATIIVWGSVLTIGILTGEWGGL